MNVSLLPLYASFLYHSQNEFLLEKFEGNFFLVTLKTVREERSYGSVGFSIVIPKSVVVRFRRYDT